MDREQSVNSHIIIDFCILLFVAEIFVIAVLIDPRLFKPAIHIAQFCLFPLWIILIHNVIIDVEEKSISAIVLNTTIGKWLGNISFEIYCFHVPVWINYCVIKDSAKVWANEAPEASWNWGAAFVANYLDLIVIVPMSLLLSWAVSELCQIVKK